MATFDYNPITGNLDLVGSGASYINGVVADPTALPVTVGTPPLDAVYLAKAGSGVWLINRKPAGLYCRVANNGNAADWTYLGAFPEVNADGNWELYNSADPTKELKFDLSGIATGTTRTLTAPNANGTIARTEDFAAPPAIGSTTRNTGAFTTLSANNGTVTSNTPAFNVTQTINNAANIFNLAELTFNVTAGSSNSSYLSCISISSGVPITHHNFRRNGYITAVDIVGQNGVRILPNGNNGGQVLLTSNGYYAFTDSTTSTFGTQDLFLRRDAAGILAQHNLANPQAYRIYNTTDAGLTNFERGFIGWSSNTLRIGTEAGGTGSARALEFQTAGTNRFDIAATGNITLRALTTLASSQLLLINGGLIRMQTSGGGDGADISRDAAGIIALRSGTTAHSFRIYNTATSGITNFERANFRWASNEFIIDAEAGGTGTSLRGIKIGSATSSLLGFYGVTPVDQPATVADPAGGGTVDTEARTAINDIIDRLQELGLIA